MTLSALWLIVLPLGAAPLVYLFRRVGAGAIAAAITALFSAWLAIQLPTGFILSFFGRSIELNPLAQMILTLLFTATAILFLISSTSAPFITGIRQRTVDAGVLTGAGRTFYPLSLGILGLFVAATLFRHLGVTAILVELAAILAVFIIQGARLESTRAAQRFLALTALALPLFLLVSWRIDLYHLRPEAQSAGALQVTTLLMGVGFALWLAIVPFHNWLTATTTEAAPASAAFILIVFPTITLLILMQLLVQEPWLTGSIQFLWGMVVAGVITAFAGGILTAVQRSFSGLMGYGALYDLGCILVILGAGERNAIPIILASLVVRALTISLIAASISAIRLHVSADGLAQMAGLAYRLPVATTGLVIGGLTLAGAPLTIGFTLRWQAVQAITQINTGWTSLLVLAGIGISIGYLRAFRALLPQAASQSSLLPQKSSPRFQEARLLIIIIIVLAGGCLALGIFPNLLIMPLQEINYF